MNPNPLATGCPGLMNLSDEQRKILAAYRKLRREAKQPSLIDPPRLPDSDDDVSREGDL